MNLQELTQRLHQIRDNTDWRGFHSPKHLAMAASVEMAELVEIFQWLSEDESRPWRRRRSSRQSGWPAHRSDGRSSGEAPLAVGQLGTHHLVHVQTQFAAQQQ